MGLDWPTSVALIGTVGLPLIALVLKAVPKRGSNGHTDIVVLEERVENLCEDVEKLEKSMNRRDSAFWKELKEIRGMIQRGGHRRGQDDA